MVRVLQPAGFTRNPLVQIGLVEGVDEVILLCSPESMTDLEFERLSSIAKNLGSQAEYKRVTIPVIGADASVQKILQNLTSFKESLPDKKTIISTTGSTLKFGSCLLYTFPECETITMNWKDSSYYLSSGVTNSMAPLPKDIVWNLLGLRHKIKNGEHELYENDKLIAKPSNVSLRGDKLLLEWKNDGSRRHVNTKRIALEMGLLCRINSEDRYEFVVSQPNFEYSDRYPINTKRPVQFNSLFKPVSNEFFSNLQIPTFPYGKTDDNNLCLHVIVNTNDITPTVYSILLHRPNHVVLWFLNSAQSKQDRLEIEGKVAFMISYLSGNLIPDLTFISNKEVNKSSVLKSNPPPELKIQFHLMQFNQLNDTPENLPPLPATTNVLVEHNSGFLGFQQKMLNFLRNSGVGFQRWYTDVNTFESTQITHEQQIKKNTYPNLSRLMLRKRIPLKGKEISLEKEYLRKLGIVLPLLLRTKKFSKDCMWKIGEVKHSDEDNNFVSVRCEKFKGAPAYFEINLKEENKFLTIGNAEGQHTLGRWLEEIAAYMIHYYWNSYSSVIGLESKPLTGASTLGTVDDIDIYCITDFGVVIGEAKAHRSLTNQQLRLFVGQLMGEVAVLGHRRGQIPMIVVAIESEQFDVFAREHNIVICSWWELQYPKRILHRFKTGKRTKEEREEKARELAEEKEEKARKLAEKEARENERLAEEREEKARELAEKEARKNERLAEEREEKARELAEKEARNLFKGEIGLHQIKLVEGSQLAVKINGVKELDNVVIAIAKNKFKTYFAPERNRNDWIGYEVKVLSEIPENILIEQNATAYLIHCKQILDEVENDEEE